MDPVTASIEKDKVKDYWFARHYEETYVLAASLPNQALGDLFIAFSFEQAERRGHTHAALQLKNHNQSLLEIDGIVGGLSHASAKDFSSRIDALTLKSYALWWEFLGRNGYPVPSRSEARSLSDARRIEAILEELSFSADKSLIREFLDNVRRAERPPSISTQRLYTRAAKNLIDASGPTIDQSSLDAWVISNPGQRCSIFRFISFLNHRNGTNLIVPAKQRGRKRKKSVADATDAETLLYHLGRSETKEARRCLLVTLIVFVWGLDISQACSLPREDLKTWSQGTRLRIQGAWVLLDSELARAFERHLDDWELRAKPSRSPLFPGRPRTEPLTVETLKYHLRKLDVSVLDARVDARLEIRRRFRRARA